MTLFEVGILVVFPGFLVIAIALGEAIRRRVRSHHPEAWAQLGRPSLLRFETFNSFLEQRAYRALGDKRLARLSGTLIWLRRAFLLLGSIWFLSFNYRRPILLGAVVLVIITVTVLNRYAQRRRKKAV